MRISRLLVTPLLALALVFSIAETMVADACDAAPATETIGAGHGDSDAGGAPGRDGHRLHLCHCVHIHGAVLTVDGAAPQAIGRLSVLADQQSAPRSIDRAPPVRPPAPRSA